MTALAQSLAAMTAAYRQHNDSVERGRARPVGALGNGLPVVVMVAWHGRPVREVIQAHAAQIGEDLESFLGLDSTEAFRRLREQPR